eukprot:403349913
MMFYEDQTLSSIKISPTSTNYKGPLFCLISRMFSILNGVISKQILLQKGYQDRLKQKRMQKENTQIDQSDLDERGYLKKRYVNKSSVLNKRAQFYKSLNDKIIQEASKNEESENTTDKSKSRRSSEDTNPDKRRALENLRRLKRSSIDRLLRTKQAFIMKRDGNQNLNNGNTETLTLNDTKTDLMGKLNASRNQFYQKVEDGNNIENDFFENLELEAIIDDYDHVQLHMHLFEGTDDVLLSKLDSVFDQVIYDDQVVGIDDYSTYELHSVGGALGAFPLTLLGSFLAGEMPQAYYDLLNGKIVGPMGESYGPVAVVSIFSILFALRPYFLHKLVFNTSPQDYFVESLLSCYLFLVISVTFVDTQGEINQIKNAALFITAFAYFLFQKASISNTRNQEIESSIELIKSTLNLGANIDELNKIETQLQQIQDILGIDALNRIMLDAAIMKDYKCLYLTANPILHSRRLFDSEYDYRVADWGGGYPRPFREIVHETWKSKDYIEGQVIVISEDPHLSRKALQQASELKQEVLMNREIEKERKRREKIEKIYQERNDEQKKIQEELAKQYLLPLPTQQTYDPKMHFNSSIDMLKNKYLIKRKVLNLRKDILFKESDVPENFREKIKERKTLVPQSFLHSMYKLLDEKSIQIQLNQDLENSTFRNIFQQADWLNSKKAGALLGVEDFVKLDRETKLKEKAAMKERQRTKEFSLKRINESGECDSDDGQNQSNIKSGQNDEDDDENEEYKQTGADIGQYKYSKEFEKLQIIKYAQLIELI